MPTQEERVTTLEQSFTNFQREQTRYNRKTNEDLTMLLGLLYTQRSDTKRILARLDTVEQLFDGVDLRLDRVELQLNGVESRLETMESDIREVKTLLTQLVKNSQNPS